MKSKIEKMNEEKTWYNQKFYNGDRWIVVTLPKNDLYEHDEPGFICKCRPKVLPATDKYLEHIIHNSFDLREKFFGDNC